MQFFYIYPTRSVYIFSTNFCDICRLVTKEGKKKDTTNIMKSKANFSVKICLMCIVLFSKDFNDVGTQYNTIIEGHPTWLYSSFSLNTLIKSNGRHEKCLLKFLNINIVLKFEKNIAILGSSSPKTSKEISNFQSIAPSLLNIF